MMAPAPAAPPWLAVGILSAILPRVHPARRAAIRAGWLRFPEASSSVLARFVLRCGLDDATAPAELRLALTALRNESTQAGDVVCSPLAAAEGRMRGPVMALVWWLRHAIKACKSCRFVAKADDDVYVHLHDMGAHLAAIPSEAANLAYYGYVGYYSIVEWPGRYFGFHGWGPYFQAANWRRPTSLELARLSRKISHRDGESNATRVSVTAGPFPFACGPFLALGFAASPPIPRAPSLALQWPVG